MEKRLAEILCKKATRKGKKLRLNKTASYDETRFQNKKPKYKSGVNKMGKLF